MKYDLEERTAKFGEQIIGLSKKIQKNALLTPLIDQLIRSGTSIGANYCEANESSSKKDFQNKIFICKKEANETKYWLRMIINADDSLKDECRALWQEAYELVLIFSKIIVSSKQASV